MNKNSLTLCLHFMKLCRLTYKMYQTDARQTKMARIFTWPTLRPHRRTHKLKLKSKSITVYPGLDILYQICYLCQIYSKLSKTFPGSLSYIRSYVHKKHNIHIILVINVLTCIVYVNYILIFIFVSNKFLSRSYIFFIVEDIGGSKQPAPQEVL